MDDKINFLQNQVMPGVGDDTPLQFNFNLSVPPSMVNKPGLWQQLLLQLKDVYPVDLEADLGKVLVVQPVLGQSEEDCTQFLFNWIHVVNEIEEGAGIDVDSTDPRKPVISVFISDDPGNNITIGSDDGVFTPTYNAGASLETDEVDGVITFNVVVSGDLNNAIRLGTDGSVFAPQITINGITQDTDGNITIGPEDIGEYGVVPFGPDGNIPVDPADIGDHGVPPLDANGKISLDNIPEALLGAVNYQGTWEASTNTPALPTAAPENKGWYFVATDSGTWNGIDFTLGDWVISNGTAWDKIDTLDSVVSVNGKQGAVTITKADVGLGNVDNTSDANKPVSTAQQAALNTKLNNNTSGTITAPSAVLNLDSSTGHGNYIRGRRNTSTNCWWLGMDGNSTIAVWHNYLLNSNLSLESSVVKTNTNFTASGNVTAYSDPRLKNFHGKLKNSWDKIKNINSFYYTWNEKASEGVSKEDMQIGFNAVEIQAEFPELVLETEEGILTVDYGKFSAVLLDVVRQLQNRVEELEAKQ